MTPQEVIEKHGLTIESEFVPFSQSRNRGEKSPSLNWSVTLMKDGRAVLTTDYSAGAGHAPSYKQTFGPADFKVREREAAVKTECETGFAHKSNYVGVTPFYKTSTPIRPDALDVIYSLISDSDVLEHAGFETWARDLGYDVDSRKAESTYRACLEIALKLRSALGDAALAELRDAFVDY